MYEFNEAQTTKNMFFKLRIGIKHIANYTDYCGLNILGVTCFVVVIKNNHYYYWHHQHNRLIKGQIIIS
jgi:hypothetical protein